MFTHDERAMRSPRTLHVAHEYVYCFATLAAASVLEIVESKRPVQKASVEAKVMS